MRTLKNAKIAVDNRLQKEVSELDVKEWDNLLSTVELFSLLLLPNVTDPIFSYSYINFQTSYRPSIPLAGYFPVSLAGP